MSGEQLEGIRSSSRAIHRHPLVVLIDEHHESEGNPQGISLHIDYVDDSGQLSYPQISMNWEDLPPEACERTERAHVIAKLRSVLLSNVRKLVFGIESLAEIIATDRKAFVAIEYHAESYYIRLSSMVEQLHRLIGEVLGLSKADREPLHQLIRRIASAAPVVGSELNCLRSRLQSAKIRRNEVAHQAEYDDERLQGLRSFLHTQAQFEMGFPASRQDLALLARYRDEFVADACIELSRAFADIATVFDSFLPVARATLNRNEPA